MKPLDDCIFLYPVTTYVQNSHIQFLEKNVFVNILTCDVISNLLSAYRECLNELKKFINHLFDSKLNILL